PTTAAPEHLGEALGQMIEQELEQLLLPRGALRQAGEYVRPALLEQPPALGELGGETLVDLDPLGGIERPDAHGKPPGTVEKGQIAWHRRKLGRRRRRRQA